MTREPQQRRYPVGEMLEARFGLDAPRRNQLARLTEIALTFALIIAALPFLMLQWGFSGADIRDWFKSLFFGIEIGQFRISLARILLGIVLFIALLFATRLLQRWLREKALQQTRMDPGIVNSIDTVVGYVGIALAALLAVSYAGLDITNLAIVAGALSVGIGFGLQSIVNNFVSGLILLIERPIKVGDRIVVGDQQGLVRRISVRATEIETFDRASLIVPNSELITGRVLNWTHRNSLVRRQRQGRRRLRLRSRAGDRHPEEMRRRSSRGAAQSAAGRDLRELRRQRADVQPAHLAARHRQLRRACSRSCASPCCKALRAANIEIPFNQLDVNLRDLDAVKRYLAQHLQERRRRRPMPASPAARRQATANGRRGNRRVGSRRVGRWPISPTADCLLPSLPGTPSRGARGAPGLRARGWRWGGRRAASGRSARPSPRRSRSVPSSMRASAASILAISLRWRSRALQLQRAIGLGGGAIGEVGMLRGVLVQDMQRLAVLAHDLFLPGHQLVAEVDPVALVHERLALGRAITLGQDDAALPGACSCGPPWRQPS